MKKLKIGVFGTGRGMDIAKNFMLLGCDIVAVCDNRKERLKKATDILGDTAAQYDDFDESMLDGIDDEDDFEGEKTPEDEFGISESRKAQLMPIIENLVKTIKNKNSINEEGTKLNDFGKHPGYRKKPMNLPTTGSDNENGMKDWNDESVYSEQPFGSKIGDSAPFDKIVKAVTDSVMEAITGKKKI
jgi:hypothetical protein